MRVSRQMYHGIPDSTIFMFSAYASPRGWGVDWTVLVAERASPTQSNAARYFFWSTDDVCDPFGTLLPL